MKRKWKIAAIGMLLMVLLLICLKNQIWEFWEQNSAEIFEIID